MPLRNIITKIPKAKPVDTMALALEHISEELSTPGNIKTTVEESSRHKKAGLAMPKIPRPGGAIPRPKTQSVGRFTGQMTANALKPPGRSAVTQAVRPTRGISNAMNAFRTSPISY